MINNVTGYAGFKSYGDKPYSFLKPGQEKLERDYYKEATTEKPNGEVVLQNFSRYKSIYDQSQSTNVKLGDYKVPAKSMNTMVGYQFIHKPSLFNSTKLGRDQLRNLEQGTFARTSSSKNNAFAPMTLTNEQETVAKHINPTEHWGSTYKHYANEVAQAEKLKSRRPLWSINREAYSSSRGLYSTEFQEAFGKFGDNPRERIQSDARQLTHIKNDLTVGTTQVTNHVPGYNGFIPQIDINQKVIEQSKGTNPRTTIIKQNIVENYAVRLPGYLGHKPMSVVNDRGSLRPQCLSTAGESFN